MQPQATEPSQPCDQRSQGHNSLAGLLLVNAVITGRTQINAEREKHLCLPCSTALDPGHYYMILC